MKHFLWIILFVIIGYLAYSHFITKNYFVLNKINLSDIDEVDTIEAYPDRGLYILQLIRGGALGHFSMDLGILKQDVYNSKDFVLYEFDNNNNSFRVTKDGIAFINTSGVANWGWFYFKEGKITEPLPEMDKISDSITAIRDVFVNYKNGYINLLKNGKRVQQYNYGNLILKDSTRNFDL